MATHPIPADVGALVTLDSRHREELRAFLERDVALNLFALSWLENYGVSSARPGVFHFRGVFDGRAELQAMALVITDRLILLDATRDSIAAYMGRWYCEAAFHFQHIVSAAVHVEPFWEAYSQASWHNGARPIRARLVSPQKMYVLDRNRWTGAQAMHHDQASTGLREATMADLDAVFLASARMHREETLEDPLDSNPATFRSHVRHRIESGRSFVWYDTGHRLMFKADISAQSRYGVQISGVYTAPQFRGQGLGTRAMIDLCRAMFSRGWPRVTLYVNAENAAALRVYDRVGFDYYDEYATIFVAP